MPQPFLHAGQHGLVVARLEIDHPVGGEPGLCERGCKEIGPRDAPEHFADRAGGDARREEDRGGAVDRSVPATGDFVQRSQSQPATRES